MDQRTSAFDALSDAVLHIAAELEVEPILQKLVHAARDLVGARYAALGVPDPEGGFGEFITSGMTDDEIAAIGPLPRQHGLLGAMLADPTPFRTDDIRRDDRFEGWPAEHPVMRSFLGVPIVSHGDVIGAFYLTDKRDAATFSDDDQALIELFAAHAAVAMTNAQLYERSRELTVIEERNRLARDLHDAVTQHLFSVALEARTARESLGPDAANPLAHIEALARSALDELRALVFELRPADLEADGLVPTLRKHVDVLQRVHARTIVFRPSGQGEVPDRVALTLFRIAQEALHNAIKHTDGGPIEVALEVCQDAAVLRVADRGAGFDPSTTSSGLGLTSMRERVHSAGGELRVHTDGSGTMVAVEVPL